MNVFPVAGAAATSQSMLLFAGVVVLVVLSVLKGRNSRRPLAFKIGILVLVIGVIGYVSIIAPRQNKVAVSASELSVSMPPYSSVKLPKSSVVDAFVVDWTATPEYAPEHRLAGTEIGSFRAGNFSLSNGKMATVLTQSTRVLVIETADRVYLLGPVDLDGFVAKVNEVFTPVGDRK